MQGRVLAGTACNPPRPAPPRPFLRSIVPQAQQLLQQYSAVVGVPAPVALEGLEEPSGNLTFYALALYANGTKVG